MPPETTRLVKTSLGWRQDNPFIPAGKIAIESDTGRRKIGVGKRWVDTPFAKNYNPDAASRSGAARYFLPTHGEHFKGAHWSEAEQKYWQWATGTDERPVAGKANSDGIGLNGGRGNVLAYGPLAKWHPTERLPGHQPKRAPHSVMTNGRPNEYGLYDMQGNVWEWCLELDGTRNWLTGGNLDCNENPDCLWVGAGPGDSVRYYVYSFRVASYTNPDNLPGFKPIAATRDANGNLVANPGFDYATDYAGVWEWTPGDTTNKAGDPSRYAVGLGAVDYDYMLCEHPVTQAEYCEFLNAVAASDSEVYSKKLYLAESTYYNTGEFGDMGMSREPHGYIRQHGSPGNYYYTIASLHEGKPVGNMNVVTGLRYCNWLHNGKPVAPAFREDTTENGAYDLRTTNRPTRETA